MREELEIHVNQTGFPVGVNSNYPARLREMVSAATITFFLQNNSIDHVRKTYLKDVKYEEDPGGNARFDRKFRHLCLSDLSAAIELLKAYPALLDRPARVGEWIADLTLVRSAYSLERAFAEADKGALFEAVAIGRMMLEQISWSLAVRAMDDVAEIKGTKVTKAITQSSRSVPSIGRLYGWMSDHVHWEYSAHLKAITSRDDQAAALFASSEFKAIAYSMLIALTQIAVDVVDMTLEQYQELHSFAKFQKWKGRGRELDPQQMIAEILQLLGESADVEAILDIITARSQ